MTQSSSQQVTIFKNIKSTDTPFVRPIEDILERIQDGSTKNLVKSIRQTKDKSERNDLKKRLPAICFSGVFNKRNDAGLKEHSGLICLDFDGYQKKKTLLEHKEKLTKDQYVFAVFISPSGNGLKVLIQVPALPDNHINYFNSLEKYFDSPYFDKMCKNVSRVCYESYDPLLHYNKNSMVWDTIAEPDYEERDKDRDPPSIPISDENKIVEILIKWWTKNHPMVEGQRNQSVFVLAMALNDYGINKSLTGYVLNQYATKGFTLAEISRTIDSAYSNTANFGTKYYEDEEKLQRIKDKFRQGVSKKEIRSQLSDSGVDNESIDIIVNKIEKEQSKKTFWE